MPISGDVDDQRSGRPRQIAADQVHVMRGGEPARIRGERVEVGERQRRRQRQRQQREPRLCAHRGEVAQVDGERAVADGVGRREAAIEVHAFDERVDRQHLEPVPLRARPPRASSPMPTTIQSGRERRCAWMAAMSSASVRSATVEESTAVTSHSRPHAFRG